MREGKIIPQYFYNREPEKVAVDLLGKLLIHKTRKGIISGIIVETESYGGNDDPASHAYKKITERNKPMFGEPGYTYIYLCYGMYYLINIVVEEKNKPAAVLIRALQPYQGIELMKKNRKTNIEKNLTNGPGKLTQALNITINDNYTPVFKKDNNLIIKDINFPVKKVIRKKRIGIKVGKDKLLRFYIKNNNFVSVL